MPPLIIMLAVVALTSGNVSSQAFDGPAGSTIEDCYASIPAVRQVLVDAAGPDLASTTFTCLMVKDGTIYKPHEKHDS